MLSVGIEFLTGRYTATNLHQYKEPEWPPHPGRLFMAMVSAYFTDGEKQNEKEALQWLEGCAPPSICYESDNITKRVTVETFVPINDKSCNGGSPLTTLEIPANRERKSRMFPTTITGYDPLYFVWSGVDSEKHLNALKGICSRIHRLGHSSSFISLTVSDSEIKIDPILIPNKLGDTTIRWVSKGLSDRLEKSFQIDDAIKDKNQYYVRKARLNAITLPEFRYSKKLNEKSPTPYGQFSDMLVLPIISNRKPNLLYTQELVRSIKNKILKSFNVHSQPKNIEGSSDNKSFDSDFLEYLFGLDVNGKPSTKPHIAIAPLAFTGNQYADGLIRGMTIIFPHVRNSQVEDGLYNVLFTKDSANISIEIKNFGNVEFSTDLQYMIETLDPDTWKKSARTWVTTTPIVLDRIPHTKNRVSWGDKVEKIISQSCAYQGLPKPDVFISNVPFLKGVPNSNLFPKYDKGRTHVHALLQFKEQITGPLLIGAGRYNGYGLCKPWWNKQWLN